MMNRRFFAASVRMIGVRHQSSAAPSSYQGSSPQFSRILSAPQCEWNSIHDTDPALGYLLRASYLDATVQLSYVPQSSLRSAIRASEATRPDGSVAPVPASQLCDRNKRVNLVLPTPFLCRLLAVLDGSQTSVDIATRSTQGTFSGNYAAYSFELACTSVLQDGCSLPWKVSFKPGQAIMLQRFLGMALERNFGFAALQENALNNPGVNRRDRAGQDLRAPRDNRS